MNMRHIFISITKPIYIFDLFEPSVWSFFSLVNILIEQISIWMLSLWCALGAKQNGTWEKYEIADLRNIWFHIDMDRGTYRRYKNIITNPFEVVRENLIWINLNV